MASSWDIPVQLSTSVEIQRLLAERVRAVRVALGFKQATLAARAGVTLSSLRRFEQTGQISLKHLLRICHALGRLDDFKDLLRPASAATMTELEALAASPARKRGSR